MDSLLSKFATRTKQGRLLGVVYLSNILLSLHYYLLIYINSSFLSQFFSSSQVSVLYIIGSSITLLLLLNVSKVIKRFGSYTMFMYLLCAEIIAVIGMAFSQNPTLIGIYFIVYQFSTPTMAFTLDLFLESAVMDESRTGEIRTAYLTLENISIVITALLIAWLAVKGNFSRVYLVSLIFLAPLYVLLKRYFRHFMDSTFSGMKVRQTLRAFLANKDIYNVFVSHLLLQIFYAFMAIYTPIYLSQYIGFSWSQIGLMLSIALLPFVFIELPAGWLADNKWGEQEMMTIGLALMGLFSLAIAFITIKSFFIWTAVLFMTRIGAALLEATTDSYFFKKVGRNDTDIIGLYRIGRPSSYIIAPILATLSLTFLAYNHIFIVLGIILIFGCHYSLSITDTR